MPFHRLRLNGGLGLGLVFLVACASITPTAPPTSTTDESTRAPQASPAIPTAQAQTNPPSPHLETFKFPKAQSVSIVRGVGDTLYAILGQESSLLVSRSTDGGRTFGEAVLATGNRIVHILTLERPAMATNAHGTVGIAWLELPSDFNGGQVWYAASTDGGQTFLPGQPVATETSGETTMVTVALDEQNNPFITWLNGSALKFTRSFDHGATFTAAQSIGNGSCECCQPQAIVHNQQLYIAYRSLEPTDAHGDIRDIVVIRSQDGGQTFGPITRVSDTHWYLTACPIAGPSLALAENGMLYAVWMDGRFAPPNTFERGDVWLAWSQDGGQSFSPNLRLSTDETLYHTKPSIVVARDGRLHVVWEAQGESNGGLYYAHSADGGLNFTPPVLVVDSADTSRGRPRMPVLMNTASDQIVLAWVDRLGVNVSLLD